jgi:hypothetical protein
MRATFVVVWALEILDCVFPLRAYPHSPRQLLIHDTKFFASSRQPPTTDTKYGSRPIFPIKRPPKTGKKLQQQISQARETLPYDPKRLDKTVLKVQGNRDVYTGDYVVSEEYGVGRYEGTRAIDLTPSRPSRIVQRLAVVRFSDGEVRLISFISFLSTLLIFLAVCSASSRLDCYLSKHCVVCCRIDKLCTIVM